MLLKNHPKLLVAPMDFRSRKPVVRGMMHGASSHLILESVSSTITLPPGTESGGRWIVSEGNADLWWNGLQAWEGVLLYHVFLGQGLFLKGG